MTPVDSTADVIVLGLGAMGSAATYQLAKRGASVIGIDQFSPPHSFGSTHGDTRITRQAIGEGEAYTPLALRSHQIWRELEAETGHELLVETGGLIITNPLQHSSAHGVSDFLESTLRSAQKYAIPHEQLSASDIGLRYPQFKLTGNEAGYFEPGAGFVLPELCVQTQLDLAKKHGATIRTKEKVLDFTQHTSGVSVRTTHGNYHAAKIILSVGPWVSQWMQEQYRGLFKVYRQVLYWFDIADSYAAFTPEKCPVFIWDFGGGEGIYGFPAIDGPAGGLKVAREEFWTTTTPEQTKRNVSEQETDEMFERFVGPRLSGVSRKCIKALACLYTVTPDFGFVLDTHPDHRDVIIASPCSGHGFKHSAAIGEALAQMALQGESHLDISAFALCRLLS